MIIKLSLVAGNTVEAGSRVAVATAVSIDTADPQWPMSLVESVTRQAQEGARRLVAQIVPPIPEANAFVPLAEVIQPIRGARAAD